MLITGPYYVSRVAEKLLSEKSLVDFTEEEFLELFKSYNAVGATLATEIASRVAVECYPRSLELARIRSNAVFVTTELKHARIEHIQRYQSDAPHACFYALSLADYLVHQAWGPNEEFLGPEPENYGLLDEAAELLRDLRVREYYDSHLVSGGLTGGARRPFTLREWYEPIFRLSRYSWLDAA